MVWCTSHSVCASQYVVNILPGTKCDVICMYFTGYCCAMYLYLCNVEVVVISAVMGSAIKGRSLECTLPPASTRVCRNNNLDLENSSNVVTSEAYSVFPFSFCGAQTHSVSWNGVVICDIQT